MTDTDPPHKIDDSKAPTNRNVNTPDTDAFHEQMRECQRQKTDQRETDRCADKPTVRCVLLKNDRTDLIADRRVRVA
jgi:hypothetical protein